MTTIGERIVVDIDREQVLRDIGYEDTSRVPARMLTLLDDALDRADALIDPSYGCVVRDVEFAQGRDSCLQGPVLFESGVVARLLQHCDRAALFCLTIGERLEEAVSVLADEGLAVQARTLDAVGSSAAEAMADMVQGDLEGLAAAQGYCVSRRFSPGYCDWAVEQQETLFDALGDCSTEVHLTDSCLMLPRKSVSGLVGMGTSRGQVAEYNPCRTCGRADCVGRRA